MVHMTHHRYDRRTVHQIVLVILLLSDGILHLSTDIFCREAELLGNDIDRLSIQALVDTHHDTDAHTSTNHLIDTDVHHRSKLRYRHELRQLQHLAFCCL